MTAAITHAFVPTIPDDPTAAAAGEVLPSHWKADHLIADGAITLTKLETIAANAIVGSVAGGAPAALTATQAKAILAIAQADVAGLVAALAALVASTRTISTTAPLTGGGDLSANRTLAVSNFGSGAAGAVPASGGGTTNYLRADGSWAAPPGTAGLPSNDAADSGDLMVTPAASTAPAAGKAKLGAVVFANGRELLAQVNSSGEIEPLQSFLGEVKVGWWSPIPGSATAPPGNGMGAPTATGTATGRTPTTTNLCTSLRRVGAVSAAGAGSVGGWRSTIAFLWRGNGAGLGGFTFAMRFNISDAAFIANGRLFCGVTNVVSAPTDVEPDSLTNQIGIGCNSTDTTLQLYNAGGSTNAKTALVVTSGPNVGGSFPANTTNVDAYSFELYCKPNDTTIYYRVRRLNTGDVAVGTLTTNLPSTTTLLSPNLWRSNGATGTAVGVDMIAAYTQTPM